PSQKNSIKQAQPSMKLYNSAGQNCHQFIFVDRTYVMTAAIGKRKLVAFHRSDSMDPNDSRSVYPDKTFSGQASLHFAQGSVNDQLLLITSDLHVISLCRNFL